MNHWCYAYGTKVTEGNKWRSKQQAFLHLRVRPAPFAIVAVPFASFAVKYLILLANRHKTFNRKRHKETRNKPIADCLHLKDVAFAGDQFVKNRVYKEADEEPGDQDRPR